MDKIDIAKAIFGCRVDTTTPNTSTKSDAPATNTTTTSGQAVSDSTSGVVSVLVDSGETLELPTTFSVVKGDTVILSVTNHTPIVTGVIGKGDSTDTAITEAQISADTAQATALAAISSVDVEYALGDSQTTAPTTGWTTTAPAWQADKLMWQRTVTTLGNGTTQTSDPTCIQGAAGADGKMLAGTCSTAAGTAAKVTTISGFTLYSGVSVAVVFSSSNTAASPTLNVSGTGALPMVLNGAQYAYWVAGSVVLLVYDGSVWQVCNTPLYGLSVTLGNPGAGNIFIDSDSMDFRLADTMRATIGYDSSISSSFIKSDGKIHIQAGYGASAYLCASTSEGLPTDYGFGMVKTSTGYDAAIIADNVKINGDRVLAGWTQIKTWTDQTTATYDDLAAAGYSEILIALYRSSVPEVMSGAYPISLITTTGRDLYCAGGYNGGTYGRSAVLTVSLTSAVYKIVISDNVQITSGLRWYLYAR